MDTRRIVRFLKQYGQQQSFEVIRERMRADYGDEVDQDDLNRLLESGKIVEVDGGRNAGGMEQKHYKAADDADDE